MTALYVHDKYVSPKTGTRACDSVLEYPDSIDDENRFDENKKYQIGMGVCAAQLRKNGFLVISQRDFASLEILYSKIDSSYIIDKYKIDHHQTEWYRNYFCL